MGGSVQWGWERRGGVLLREREREREGERMINCVIRRRKEGHTTLHTYCLQFWVPLLQKRHRKGRKD